MRAVKLYSPVLVLAAWAVYIVVQQWTSTLTVIGLGILAVSVLIHTRELGRFYHDHKPDDERRPAT